MAERMSKVVIGCNSCKIKARELGVVPLSKEPPMWAQPFPTETAFSQGEHIGLILGYSCPFCGEELMPTPRMMKMFERLMNGPSHIVIRQKNAEIFGDSAHVYIPLDEPMASVEEYYTQKGLHYFIGIDPYLFRNPKDDIKLLQEASHDYDRNQWTILIESGHNPEPYLRDEAAWFNLFGDI